MLCPTCGIHGKLEQTSYDSESQRYYCNVCKQKYISYGESDELVPLPAHKKNTPHQAKHLHD